MLLFTILKYFLFKKTDLEQQFLLYNIDLTLI
jgi:hypothetical protein